MIHQIKQAAFFVLITFISPLLAAQNDPTEHTPKKGFYEVKDSFGKHYFQTPPKRVVVTDWTLVEQLLSLGINPIGAPELDKYEDLSGEKLPEDIEDIGLRISPSLRKIQALEPDLIILGTDQKQLTRPFSRVAKVLYYQNFSERFNNNGLTAQKRLRMIAGIFQKNELAEDKIAQLLEKIARFKVNTQESSPALLIRFINQDKVYVYDDHSTLGWTMKELGIENAFDIEPVKFGEKQIALSKLSNLSIDKVYFLEPVPSGVNAISTIQSLMPSASAISVGKVWSYGGIRSLEKFAESLNNLHTRK